MKNIEVERVFKQHYFMPKVIKKDINKNYFIFILMCLWDVHWWMFNCLLCLN